MSAPRTRRRLVPAGPVTEANVPHDREAERRVLELVLLNGAADLAAARRMVSASDFFVPAFGVIFAALCELADRGAPIEIEALHAHLAETGRLEQAGGAALLGSLVSALGVPA